MRIESRASLAGMLRCMRVHSLFISVKLRNRKLTLTLAPAAVAASLLLLLAPVASLPLLAA